MPSIIDYGQIYNTLKTSDQWLRARGYAWKPLDTIGYRQTL